MALCFSAMYAMTRQCLPHRLSRDDADTWADKLTSTFHAFLAIGTCTYWFIQDYDVPATDSLAYGFSATAPRLCALAVTLGYLVFDALRIFYYQWVSPMPGKTDRISMLFHHGIILTAFYLGSVYHWGTFHMGLFLQNEVTTLFLNNRFFLAQVGLKDTKVYFANDVLFGATFFLDRLVGNGAIVFHMQHWLNADGIMHGAIHERALKEGVPLLVLYGLPVFAYAHCLLQMYWFARIVRMFKLKSAAAAKKVQ